jgi:ArsR family transcriptional regulator, arsenate/arsenite/antimonite-responsive transcriptional repressor / arsenate reductase (thioredoxin)
MLISAQPTPDFLKLLAHDVRWHLVAVLALSDRRVQELVEILQRPQNLISYHLRLLREGNLVSVRRSSADARDTYYSLDLPQVRTLYLASGAALHPALAADAQPEMAVAEGDLGGKQPFRILFLCTHNSARSQLAEGIMRSVAGAAAEVYSAGSEPDEVHPLAIEAAAVLGIDISQQESRHMDQFVGQTFDYVITVCDRVRESCPVFPNDPQQIHWSFADPTAVAGTYQQRLNAFVKTARELSTRINYLLMRMSKNYA